LFDQIDVISEKAMFIRREKHSLAISLGDKAGLSLYDGPLYHLPGGISNAMKR
jgi:hypothetical protein